LLARRDPGRRKPLTSVMVASLSVLYGDDVRITVTAYNPPGTYGYSLKPDLDICRYSCLPTSVIR
jgi:hypothetical protein